MKKIAVLLLPLALALAGCRESEKDCYRKLDRALREAGKNGLDITIEIRAIATLMEIEDNPDLDVCDYTVLGGQVIRID